MTEKNFTVNTGLVVKNGLTVEGGTIDFTGASSGGGVELTDLSATTAAAGTTGLAYDNTTGVFTYTPADLSSYLTDITGQSLYSLSNVYTSSSPTDGQVLTWDNANSYWKPTTVSAGSTFAGADYFKINPALVSAASATGSDALSAGRGASNAGDYSVVLGSAGFATSAADYGLAVGWNANVSAVGGQAIGTMAAVGTNENYSLALGYQAQATAANQLVLGSTNSSYGYSSILVGNASYTPSQSMDLTTKDYVDTAVAGAGGGGGSSFAAADYVKVNSTSTAASATGTDGIAIGYNAQADGELRKISIGHRAGYSTTIGNDSISIGYYAGARNQQDFSVYIGRAAGQAAVTNTTGNRDQDVGIGYQALYTASANYSGEKNTGIGAYALGQGSLSSGSNNVAVGRYCGSNLTTGSNNVFMGASAAAYANSPTQSIVIGYNAGYSYSASYRFVNNAYAILIGASTSCSSTTSSREIVIGQGEMGKGTNTFNVAAASGAYHTGNTSSWSTSSDERVKKNISDYTTGLTALNQINVKSFNYKSDEEIAADSPELANEDGIVRENLPQDKLDVGILAQELETVLPNCVTTRENGIKTVVKDEMFWVMLNAIKELSAKNDALEARIVALENA